MRLLKTKTSRLEFDEFSGREIPLYAILSHTWGPEEVSLQDILSDDDGTYDKIKHRAGYRKILRTRDIAASHGFDYVWIDTCCIDKSSSAELSEAINSMYRWYEESDMCYAYLEDMLFIPIKYSRSYKTGYRNFYEALKPCRWFTRGWTLQELIAPAAVMFYDREWTEIGDKQSLATMLCEITTIPDTILLRQSSPASASVAERMSWASIRETTRPEDLAYCLLGIFDVNMPMLYGEGDKAFIRLQEEIIKASDDHSIFAWSAPLDNLGNGPLATSPAAFLNSGNFVPLDSSNPVVGAITVNNKGVHIKVILHHKPETPILAVLPCMLHEDIGGHDYRLAFGVNLVAAEGQIYERVANTLRVYELNPHKDQPRPTVICIRRRQAARNHCPVAKAAAHGNITVARLQLAKGITTLNRDVLRAASEGGNSDMVELVLNALEKTASLEASELALPIAAQNGHTNLVVLLMRHGVQPGIETLREAVQNGHSGVVSLLLDAGLPPDTEMLQTAAASGHEEVVKALMKSGLPYARSILHTAVENGQEGVVRLLLRKMSKPSAEILRVAAAAGKDSMVQLLLEEGVVPDAVVLEEAVANGHETVAQLLLQKGVQANANTLLTAATHGHEEAVRLLLKRGIRPNLRIVRAALEEGYEEVARVLEDKLRPHQTTMRWAVENDREELVQSQLDKGVEPRPDVLEAAAKTNSDNIVKLLSERGYKVNRTETPLSSRQ
ncbi:ankyrin repeat-containing domain protein [Podospora australis]|uniref:Ankyrin repeat-containing domain protein n=1 Tax=Podospora australis TaxID=1536484 RepID=A0AAN7AC77_9PEZI|nr:ankyrin repeat-containing domain protein [Podospora australis]